MGRRIAVRVGVASVVGYPFLDHYLYFPEHFSRRANVVQSFVLPHLVILGVSGLAVLLALAEERWWVHGNSRLRGLLGWGIPVGLASWVLETMRDLHYHVTVIGLDALLQLAWGLLCFGIGGAALGAWFPARKADAHSDVGSRSVPRTAK
jgi:hypothetical protein